MRIKFWLAFIVALALTLSTTPVWAQGPIGDGRVVFGNNTTIGSGETVNSLAVFGGNATIESGGKVQGDAVLFGGNLRLRSGGEVNGELAIFGGNASIDGTVSQDIAVAGGAIDLGPTAVVNGNIRVAGGSINRDPAATVRGTVSNERGFNFGRSIAPVFRVPFVPGVPFGNPFADAGLGFLRGLISSLALAVLGVLLIVLAPEPTRRVVMTAQQSLGRSFGTGCLTLIFAPILLILLVITIIGIPVALIGIFVAVAAWIFGWIAIGYLAGERVLQELRLRQVTSVLAVVVGVFLLALVGQVPLIGWLVSLVVGTIGIGAVILTRFGTRPYYGTPALITPAPTAPGSSGSPSNALVPAQPNSLTTESGTVGTSDTTIQPT